VNVVDGEILSITKVSRLHMAAYLCVASNGVPPSISKVNENELKTVLGTFENLLLISPLSQRVQLKVQCKHDYRLKATLYLISDNCICLSA
jgi:hypothetical protein